MHARLQNLGIAACRLVWHYPYFAIAAPLVIVFSIAFCRRDDSEWEYVYVVAANHLRQGVDIYTDGNSYPPFAAFSALPASFLPPALVRLSWLLVNLGCFGALVLGAWRLAGGPRLQGARRGPRAEHVAAVLGFLCGVGYLQNSLAHQQNDVILGALLVAGCLALSRSHSLRAATCFGLAAALKCTGLLWLPYLLWRGRPVAAAWLLVVAVGVNLLPDLVSSPPSGQLWLTEYATRYLVPITAADHVAGTWGSDVMYNQSLAGAGQRWLVADRQNPVRPEVLRAAVVGVEAALLLATLAVCRRPFRKLERRVTAGVDPEVVEYAVVLLLMLLSSPMSSKAHFGVLIVPGFLLARAAITSGSPFLWVCLLGSTALALLSNKDPLGEDLYTLTLWYGTATWQALILLLGCLTVVWRLRTSETVNTKSADNGQVPRQAA
jgi:hypothetical protein